MGLYTLMSEELKALNYYTLMPEELKLLYINARGAKARNYYTCMPKELKAETAAMTRPNLAFAQKTLF